MSRGRRAALGARVTTAAALLLAASGCESVPQLTFKDLDARSEGGDASDARDANGDVTPGSCFDNPPRPPPNAEACCANNIACAGACDQAVCSKCESTCVQGQLCCGKGGTGAPVTCRGIGEICP